MGPKATPTPETVIERFENKQRDVKIKDANEVLELDCVELVEMYNKMKDNLNLLSDLTGAEFDQLYPDYNARLATIKRDMIEIERIRGNTAVPAPAPAANDGNVANHNNDDKLKQEIQQLAVAFELVQVELDGISAQLVEKFGEEIDIASVEANELLHKLPRETWTEVWDMSDAWCDHCTCVTSVICQCCCSLHPLQTDCRDCPFLSSLEEKLIICSSKKSLRDRLIMSWRVTK